MRAEAGRNSVPIPSFHSSNKRSMTMNSSVKTPFYGGCACGAIRYECTAEPLTMFCCHCRDCQQASGGPYAPAILVPSNAFKITQGSPRYYTTSSAAGGTHTRGFCPDCGSRLLGAVDPSSAFIGVVASSLDDPSWFRPRFDIFTSDVQPWDYMNPELPKFERYAPFDDLK
jgi:hypothetical protein